MKKALIALLMGFMALPAIATNTNSIVENLQELIEARDAITNAIVQKGGTVTSGALTNAPNEILSIPSGGGGGPFAAIVSRQQTPTWTVSASDLAGVTTIGSYVFYDCSGLTSIEIPDSVTSIGEYAFYYCSGLTSITIPNSVTSVASRVFMGCTGLPSITIPDSVTSIGDSAFYGCSNLATVDFDITRSTIPTLGNVNAFSGISANYQIWVPGELLATWKNTENWIDLASHICPYQAIDGGECISEGNGVSLVGGDSGTFDANAAFDIDSEGATMFSENSTLWIGDSIHAIDNSGFEGDFGGPMYNDGQNNGCWSYLKFCNIPQEEVETWSGYPWGFPTNRISYLSRPE